MGDTIFWNAEPASFAPNCRCGASGGLHEREIIFNFPLRQSSGFLEVALFECVESFCAELKKKSLWNELCCVVPILLKIKIEIGEGICLGYLS